MIPKRFASQLQPGDVLIEGELVESVYPGYYITVRLRGTDGVSFSVNYLDDIAVELSGYSNCVYSGLPSGHSPYNCTADSCI